MNKRKSLGQHFLISDKIAQKIVSLANINNQETVLEIGPGKGILTKYLVKKAKKVIAIEADKTLFDNLIQKLRFENLTLKHADGFKSKERFDVFVSNIPYSQTKTAIEWLLNQNFDRSIIMVQKEFAQKLMSTSKEKRAISILAQYAFDIEKALNVNKNNFLPVPQVDSVIIRMRKKNIIDYNLIVAINKLFSYRRKKLRTVLKNFDIEYASDKRIEDLDVNEIVKIAKKIIKQ